MYADIPPLPKDVDIVFHHFCHPFLVFIYFSPWRIVDDAGGAFSMGCIGGGLFVGIKGFKNAPTVSNHQNGY